jgi:hypothetical protein
MFGKRLLTNGDQEMIAWKKNTPSSPRTNFRAEKHDYVVTETEQTPCLKQSKSVTNNSAIFEMRHLYILMPLPGPVPIHPFSNGDHGVLSLLKCDLLKLMLEFQESTLFDQNSKKVAPHVRHLVQSRQDTSRRP